jgi:hypothetical protein
MMINKAASTVSQGLSQPSLLSNHTTQFPIHHSTKILNSNKTPIRNSWQVMCKITEVKYSRCKHITEDDTYCKIACNTGICFRKPKVTRFIRKGRCVGCREKMIDEALKALELLWEGWENTGGGFGSLRSAMVRAWSERDGQWGDEKETSRERR